MLSSPDWTRSATARCRHSSNETGEQCWETGGGVGGAKGGDQGECEPAKHAPGAGPGERVTGAGAHTTSRKAKEEGTVHDALPPPQPGNASYSVLRTQAQGCPGKSGISELNCPGICFGCGKLGQWSGRCVDNQIARLLMSMREVDSFCLSNALIGKPLRVD